MKRICVFCGSSGGGRPVYMSVARELGQLLVREGFELVYGGGKIGLMGEMARAVLEAGGHVIGVIPAGLEQRELALRSLPDLRVVGSMHERKALMADLSDAFIALPGGLGTMEEFFEALTWAQLGIHRKPCGLLNVEGFYNPLMAFMDHVTAEAFMEPETRGMILMDERPEVLLALLKGYTPPVTDKVQWVLERDELRNGPDVLV